MTISSSPDKSGAHISESPENLTAGQMLRQAREKLGLSLADVAAVTRVPRNMLEHLERDRFAEYAAPVFARGHLINFAREVRLDPERVLLAYERQTGLVRPSLEFEPPVHPPRSRARGRSAETTARKPSVAVSKRFPQITRLSEFVRPIHMVTALLLMCALFASAFFLNGSSATAQNPAEFSNTSADEEGWSLEKDADQARWFLEQPAAATSTSEP